MNAVQIELIPASRPQTLDVAKDPVLRLNRRWLKSEAPSVRFERPRPASS